MTGVEGAGVVIFGIFRLCWKYREVLISNIWQETARLIKLKFMGQIFAVSKFRGWTEPRNFCISYGIIFPYNRFPNFLQGEFNFAARS